VGRRLTAIAAALLVAAPFMAPAAAPAAGPPRIVKMNYFVRDDGSLPHVRLLVGVKRADSVRVATVFHGKHAGAPTRLDDNISGDPWVLQHNSGAKVYKLIRRSLERRGSAAVRIRARNGAGIDRAKLKIRESDCTKDPPFYPLDCTIHR
jgi:hypothetical protein